MGVTDPETADLDTATTAACKHLDEAEKTLLGITRSSHVDQDNAVWAVAQLASAQISLIRAMRLLVVK